MDRTTTRASSLPPPIASGSRALSDEDVAGIESRRGAGFPTEGLDQSSRDAGQTVVRWEYLIVVMPPFQPPTRVPGGSDAVHALNEEGALGWEAVTMMELADGRITTLLKRPRLGT